MSSCGKQMNKESDNRISALETIQHKRRRKNIVYIKDKSREHSFNQGKQ